MEFVENNFETPFHVLYIQQKNQKDKIVSMPLPKCKIVSGIQPSELGN